MKKATLMLAALAVSTGTVSAVQATEAVPTPRFMRVACEQEDGRNCYWDAGSQGNGFGHSFFAIPAPNGRTLVRYWDRAYGRTHDRIVD